MGARLHSIEALRGLAALSVAWFHLTNGYTADSATRISGSYGWLGVDCFFVISGFVIPYSLHRSNYRVRDFWRFMARRLVRLEPPYLASIALVIMLYGAASQAPGFRGVDPNYSVAQVSAHLLYLIPLTPYEWISPVYWSLAFEFAFYITMGLLFPLLWARHLIVTVLLGGAVFAAMQDSPGLLLFVLGISAMRFYVGRDPLWQFVACATVCASLMAAAGAPLSGIVGLVTAAIIVFARFPAWPPLAALGAISYSLYLVHVPIGGRVVNLGGRFIDGQLQELMLSLAALIVSLICAWAFYRLIEVASTRQSKKIAARSAA